jgi:cytochrome oxidase assembly protein ShyY1
VFGSLLKRIGITIAYTLRVCGSPNESISTAHEASMVLQFFFMSKLYVFPLITSSLGCWQLYRLKWKVDMIERIQNHPVEIATFQPLVSAKPPFSRTDFDVNEFELYKLKGNFMDTILIGPRPRASHEPPPESGINPAKAHFQRNIGWIVISKFRTIFGDVLVNRGWLPDSKKSVLEKPIVDEVQKAVTWKEWVGGWTGKNIPTCTEKTIIAQARASEPSSMFVKNDKDWKWIDVDALSNHLNCLPICFEMSSQFAFPKNELDKNIWTRTTKREIKNDHLEYALTWFGLTIAMTMLIRTKGRGRKLF